MCGRYVIFSTPEAIRALFRYGEQPNFPPRYNIAPASSHRAACRRHAVVRADAMGPVAVMGRGAKGISASYQCARRIRARQTGVPQCHAPVGVV